MVKVQLINMPFADINRPALSLTQLKAVSKDVPVDMEIVYLNQDFGHYFGADLFQGIADQYTAGLGDWMFRELAFPEEPDNADAYLGRHFPFGDPKTKAFKQALLEKRAGLRDFLEGLISKYQIDDARLVGYTSMFSQNVACFALSKMLKEHNPKIITTMGGANCETPMGQEIAKGVSQIDFVFSGPALISFPRLLGHLLEDDMDACHRIPGVFSKKNVAQLGFRDLAGEELPIDEPVMLDYRSFITSFDENFPDLEEEKLLTMETSRGCWWGARSHCTFCGLNGETMAYRAMSPNLAIKQFESLFSYADDCSHFVTVDNILPQNYTKEVFPRLDPPPHIDLFYEVKADLSEEELALLSEKRVKRVQPGIESLATSTLKLMKKGTTAFGNIIFLRNCALYDVVPAWNLLMGFPGEGENVYQKYMEDLPLLVHLPPPSGVYPVRFDRFSPYFTKADTYKLALRPYEFYKYVYPLDETSLANLAYYFQDTNYSADYIKAMTRWIGKLRQPVHTWERLWKNSSETGQCHPYLYFKSPTTIYDSRSGEPLEFQISDVARRVLDTLDRPRGFSTLATLLKEIPNFDPAREIASLQDKGLVFQEGQRYLNLVFPRKGSKLIRT